MIRIGFTSCMAVLLLSSMGATASANSTLPFIGNACDVDEEFRIDKKVRYALGRVTLTDVTGAVLQSQENVVATPTDHDKRACLWQFDINFADDMLQRLLLEDVFVELALCVRPGKDDDHDSDSDSDSDGHRRSKIRTHGVTSCSAADPAVSVIFEPVDTLLDDVAAAILGAIEASCPVGSALQSVNIDGTPQFVCTPQLATSADLDEEANERAAGDTALDNEIDALQTELTAETAARQGADHLLRGQIAANGSAIAANAYGIAANANNIATNANSIAANANNIATLEAADVRIARDVAVNAAEVSGLRAFQSNLVGECAAGETMVGIGANGTPTCVEAGGQRVVSRLQASTSTCSYSCNAAAAYPRCSCSCRPGWFSRCSCSCESGTTARCSTDSCDAPATAASCPDVGGTQGPSALTGCAAPSPGLQAPDFDRCEGKSVTATGPIAECSSSSTKACSCSCRTRFSKSCSCSCTPAGQESCSSTTETSAPTVSARAVCMSIE